jgi:hypothetical protein
MGDAMKHFSIIAIVLSAVVVSGTAYAQKGPACGRKASVDACYECSINSGGLKKYPANGIMKWCQEKVAANAGRR